VIDIYEYNFSYTHKPMDPVSSYTSQIGWFNFSNTILRSKSSWRISKYHWSRRI